MSAGNSESDAPRPADTGARTRPGFTARPFSKLLSLHLEVLALQHERNVKAALAAEAEGLGLEGDVQADIGQRLWFVPQRA